jgi:hypothetical protein
LFHYSDRFLTDHESHFEKARLHFFRIRHVFHAFRQGARKGGSIANNVVKKKGEKSDSFEFPSLAKRGEGRFYE